MRSIAVLIGGATLLGLDGCIDRNLTPQRFLCVSGKTPCRVDGGYGDAGGVDAGRRDAGLEDWGVVDVGVVDAGVVDAGVVDAGVVDAGVVDAGVVDAGVVDADVAYGDASRDGPCAHALTISSPGPLVYLSARADLSAMAVADPSASGQAQVLWETSTGASITTPIEADGHSFVSIPAFGRGHHTLRARLVTPTATCDNARSIDVVACDEILSDAFDQRPNDQRWIERGAAIWTTEGVVQLTDAIPSQQGALISTSVISGGSLSLRFKARTGGGGGADGIAATIIEMGSLAEVVAEVESAEPGGGLGYAVGGIYGSFVGTALTVEIDTWYNYGDAAHLDPTSSPHVELTRGADPGHSLGYAEFFEADDDLWHDFRVDMLDGLVELSVDGSPAVRAAFPAMFEGAHLFFSGSTGGVTDRHSIDDVQLFHQCD